jgi:sugar-specific transcriptional regulator TrmB
MKINDFAPILEELGLRPAAAKLYLACLSLGQSTVTKISDQAGVQRTFAYEVLDELVEQGLISTIEKGGVKHYNAISVDKFRSRQREKLAQFERVMPELKALERTASDRPRVQFLEGSEGVMAAFEDTLSLPKGSELLAYSTGLDWHEREVKFHRGYMRRRIEKQIHARAILTDDAGMQPYIQKNKEELREAIVVSHELIPFTNEINIYGNKVAIMSMVGEYMAVIIESESIAKMQRAIFELAWRGAKQVALQSGRRD